MTYRAVVGTIIFLFICACPLSPCYASLSQGAKTQPAAAGVMVAASSHVTFANQQPATEVGQPYAPIWRPLAARLAADGISGARVNALLGELAPEPTQAPMGRKIRELYQRSFLRRPGQPAERQQYYKGVVTQANAALCREYIRRHEAAFRLAQNRYGVSPAIASALLFVETRLGKVLADIPENAFYTLASMAISTRPEDISQWLPRLPGYEKHLAWLDETLRKRSDWAYNEVRALIEHMLRDEVQPSQLPGSIYGAVGLCQFMPSNISAYGADGDGDGRVNLFNDADAIASLANYLARHGWKKGISRQTEHRLLMTYNHSTVYANTILALSDLVSNPDKKEPAPVSPRKKARKS